MTALVTLDGVSKFFAARSQLAGLFGRDTAPAVAAVDGVSLEIRQGEILGLIGESGSGKTTLARLLLCLERPDAGRIVFADGRDVGALRGNAQRLYYRDVQMIFQDPYGSINPRFTVFDTIAEPLRTQRLGTAAERPERVVRAMTRAGLKPVETYLHKYPHELSGGERQRLSIARALVLEPKMLVADEPVSMLDVSIRASILNLMKELAREYGLTIVYISHDLSTTRYLCDRIVIMYRGRFVETGEAEAVIDRPAHPYAQALKAAIPIPDPTARRARADPDRDEEEAAHVGHGCRYAGLCPKAMDRCLAEVPPPFALPAERHVACFLHEDAAGTFAPASASRAAPRE